MHVFFIRNHFYETVGSIFQAGLPEYYQDIIRYYQFADKLNVGRVRRHPVHPVLATPLIQVARVHGPPIH